MNNKEMNNKINEFIEKSLLHTYMVLKPQIEEYLLNQKTNLHFSVQSESFFDNISQNYQIQNKSIKIKPKQQEKHKDLQSRRIAIQNILLKFQTFMNYTDNLLRYSHIVYGKPFSVNLNFDINQYIEMCNNYADKYDVDINEKNPHHFFKNINNPNSNYYNLKNDFLLLKNDCFNNIVSYIGEDFNIIFSDSIQNIKNNLIKKDLNILFFLSKTMFEYYAELNIKTFRDKLKEDGNKNSEHFENGLIKALAHYEKTSILSSLNNYPESSHNDKKRL